MLTGNRTQHWFDLRRKALQSPVLMLSVVLACATLVRAVWLFAAQWPVMSLDARVFAFALLIVLPGPLVMTLRYHARLADKLDTEDSKLVQDIGVFVLMSPFFAYFTTFLALEIAFLLVKHR